MRRRRGVEAEEVVRIAGERAARTLVVRRAELRADRDEPGLAGVRVEAGLEERLTRTRLVGDGREQAVHARSRRRRADTGQEAERAVGTARLLDHAEHH